MAVWRYDRSPRALGIGGSMTPLDAGCARFRDPAYASVPLPPFPAYEHEPVDLGTPVGTVQARPRFARCNDQSVVEILGLERCSFYGTGEQAGTLLRNGTRKTLWNNDHFDYTTNSRNLYQSHPFIFALRPDGSAVGVIIETTHRCDVELGGGARIHVHGPSPAVVIIERDSPQELLRALHRLIGTIPLPPLWAIGYHQCRWSYEPDAKLLEIASEFRARRIPCDCLWFDIDYMDGFRCFTFDRAKFPQVAKLNRTLQSKGFRTIYMIDCGIKVDPEYDVYAEGREGRHFIADSRGGEYHGQVWPGDCAFPDFTRAATRSWWASLYRDFISHGIDGVWNDMNEPAVFGGVEKTMPVDNRHDADAELGGPGSHARYHNLYGMLMVRATREGIAGARPDKRPFVLTRSNFLGGQRYAATWTGDNRSDWNHLRWSIPMALNMSLSGQPFVGPDIGGFIGDADGELFARWMGIGSLLPFARAHSEKTTKPHEPWSFGEECERICRIALQRRYRLLPYLYTLFRQASMCGDPIVRPLFFADPSDARLRAIDDAFLLGPDLLVMCHVHPGTPAALAPCPLEGWKQLEITKETHRDLPRLFLRPGAALPLGPVREWTTQPVDEPALELVCNPANGVASCRIYTDAGDGQGHRRGEHCTTTAVITNGKIEVSREGDTRFAPTIGMLRMA
jgi:alpha-glucosidase